MLKLTGGVSRRTRASFFLLVASMVLSLQLSYAGYRVAANPSYPELISKTSTGEPTNGWSGVGPEASSVSLDGRYVVFASNATNLDPRITSDRGSYCMPLYVRDRVESTTKLISLDPTGAFLNASVDCSFLGISNDGRYIFYAGSIPEGPAPSPKIYRYDQNSEQSTLVSTNTEGNPLTWVRYDRIGISYDGTTIAFGVENTSDSTTKVYVKNIDSNSQVVIDNGNWPLLSSDGTKVVFSRGNSTSLQAVVYDISTHSQTVVHQWSTNWRVSAFSGDGRYIFFFSQESNVITQTPAHCAASGCIYRKNLNSGEIRLVSLSRDGLTAWPAAISQATISTDGEKAILSDVDDSNDHTCYGDCVSTTGLVLYDFEQNSHRSIGYGQNNQVAEPYLNFSSTGGMTADSNEFVLSSFAPQFGPTTTCTVTSALPCNDVFVLSTVLLDTDLPNGAFVGSQLVARVLGHTISGNATDVTSGVNEVKLKFGNITLYSTANNGLSLSCNSNRTSCTWSVTADRLPSGINNYTLIVTDFAGNTYSVDRQFVVI